MFCIFECAGVILRLLEAVVVIDDWIHCVKHQTYLFSGGSDPGVI